MSAHDDPRTSLAVWLRAGRAQRKLTLEQVARITKIQRRVLEKLENGQLDGLPAEVFVRGFVRSFARCVGLDEAEAVERYGDCAKAGPAIARALVETIVEPEPVVIVEPEPIVVVAPEPVVVVAPEPEPSAPIIEIVADAAPAEKKKRTRKKPSGTTPPRSRRRSDKKPKPDAAIALPIEMPIEVFCEGSTSMPAAGAVSMIDAIVPDAPIVETVEPAEPAEPADTDIVAPGPLWKPTMPPVATAPSVPWRRPSFQTTTASAPVAPSLVIDDSDPDLAEREQTRRAAAKDQRVSFLPPILLDRDDRSQRQGGLTLAVIILLIAATLTLSYLMRRPTVSGDGVTMAETHTTLA